MSPNDRVSPAASLVAALALRPLAVAALVFGLGLALTCWLVLQARHAVHERVGSQFERQADALQRDIEAQFQRPLYALRGARGLFSASGEVSRAQFAAFVAARDLATEFPGVRGFGFIEAVPRGEVDAFVRTQQRDGAADFALRSQGDASDLLVIKFIEPIANNRAALGLDIGSEPVRRAAAVQAAASGQATLSGAIALVQDAQQRKGFLYLLALYRPGAATATPEQRLAALRGFVYAPIVLQELMASTLKTHGDMLDFELVEGTQASRETLLLDADQRVAKAVGSLGAAHYPDRQMHLSRQLRLGQRVLTLHVGSTPQWERALASNVPLLLGLGGLLLSLTLACALWLALAGRSRAQALARGMTIELDRMAKVATHTSNAVLVTDAQLRIVWVNDAFVRLTGHSREAALGQTPAELLNSAATDLAEVARMNARLRAGHSVRTQLQNRSSNGRNYWVETEMQPLRDGNGDFAGYVSIETDITARREADDQLKAALRQSAALMRTVNQYAIVSETDRAGTITRVNQAFCDITGYAEAELLGASHNIVNSGMHPQSFWAEVWQTIASNQPWRGEVCNQARDGSFYWVDSMIAPFADEQGVIERYVSIRFDITARKRLEQEVLERNKLMQNILNHIPVGLSVMDRHLNLVADNPLFRQLLDFPDALFAGPVTTFESIIRFNALRGEYGPGDPEPIIAATVERARHAQAHQFERERPGGITLAVRGAPMPGGGFVTTYADITALKQATRAAEQASRSKGQFLANMSHEIRTPMNAILGMLKLLQGTGLTTRQLDYVSKTEGAAKSLLGLLNDILDFSKVEAGKMVLDPQPFRLDRLLRDLSVIFSANIGAKPVEVLFDIDPMVPKALVGDAMRLQQVLINLGGNAIKFTARGEVVLKVVVAQREGYDVLLHFAVRDSGIGIASEHQAHIFDGFSQAEASTTRRFGGTGLGLSICKRLVDLMGGQLQLQSTPGVGSTFSFTLRLPSVDLTEEELLAQARGDIAPLTALVIDDNPTAREVVAAMVESLGWHVDLAGGGAQAIALCEAKMKQGAFPYQAVFVDWQMPGMDGWQTSQRIRELSTGEPAPIVVMVTAHGREMLAQRSAQEQSLLDAFLVKPVTASMLFDAVVDTKAAYANPQLRRGVSADSAGQRLAGLRLLVVEDNLINQQVAQELLQAEGAAVTIAGNGQLGVQAVASAEPAFDAVLMDIQMPVMDGYAATRAIRQTLGLGQLPIIAMTANAMASDRQLCLDAGMNEHIGKPFDLSALVALLLRLSGRAHTPVPVGNAPLPPSDQIDAATALQRLGGNRALYARTLRAFLRDSAGMLRQIDAALHDQLYAQAAQVLHTLKGLAATMGANPLAAVAARLETAVKAMPGDQDGAAGLAELAASLAATQHALQRLLAEIEPAASATPVDPAPWPAPDHGALAADLTALAALLHDSDMAAMDLLEQIKNRHAAHAGELSGIDDAMAMLDFASALAQCQNLLQAFDKGDAHVQP